jgi:transcriptional regulator with XRE-family HTH domain
MEATYTQQESKAQQLYDGDFIRSIRDEIGKTQADVAYEARISTRTLASIEQGESVQIANLIAVLENLGLVLKIERKVA